MIDLVVPHPESAVGRILIVEDEPLIALALTEIVTELGFQCVGPVFDLTKALELATSETLDAAILNLIIQGGTAYGVAAILDSRNIPYAFASGVPHNGLESDWKDRPFIEKPYTLEDIRAILETFIPHHNWTPREGIAPDSPQPA